jgi:methylglutaconyl-CoA hydratase
MSQPILLESRGAVAILTLNRPQVRNALSPALLEALLEHLNAVEQDPNTRAVVLTGAGGTFSSGADLENLRALIIASAEANKRDSRLLADVLKRVYTFPKPIIAALEGAAIAGGAGLATACDIIVAAENTKIGYTEVRLGFVAAIVSVFLLRTIGEKCARELLLTGKLILAPEAERIGLINRVVPQGQALEVACDLALEIARNSSTALSATKEILANIPGMGLEESLNHAAQVNAWIRGTSDLKEGVTAFLEKREPVWRSEEK